MLAFTKDFLVIRLLFYINMIYYHFMISNTREGNRYLQTNCSYASLPFKTLSKKHIYFFIISYITFLKGSKEIFILTFRTFYCYFGTR